MELATDSERRGGREAVMGGWYVQAVIMRVGGDWLIGRELMNADSI